MLAVELNRANYEYDVNSIVKAFYPDEQVSVLTPAMREEKREGLKGDVRIRIRLQEDGAWVTIDGETYDWNGPEKVLDNGKSHMDTAPESEEPMAEKAYKYGFKCFLYRVLSQVTGKSLPWGNLTGIRPTKIAYQLLEQGKCEEEIIEYYREKYYVSREKATLSVNISRRERALLASLNHEENGAGV